MRPIWKGTISFGLVSIPVSLYPATRREELKFRLLRGSDLSPVNYKRVAEADGKEVPWDQIVKGYQYEKDKYVVLKEEDFARVDVEATQTVEIIQFVTLDEVDPLLFYKPYFMEAEKGGEKAYVLLRQALSDAGKIGIAKVVIKTRQHLAALKPQARGIMLELMRFPAELLDASSFKTPKDQKVSTAEQTMAKKLVESMTQEWDPTAVEDDYHVLLEKVIEEKIQHPTKSSRKPASRRSKGNVIDLMSVLQKSVEDAQKRPDRKKARAKAKDKVA
ncbi:MAG: Ku protein [Verrucomicrobiales bacterium]|nr:Ku protein [Verrucomicrobiales bacterium]